MSLTDDDKKWMFENVVEPIRTELRGVKADLLGLEAKIRDVETNLRIEMRDLETKLRIAMRDIETNLLTAFHQWASPTEARLRTHTATLRAIDLEMEALSDRIGKLEDPGRPGISLS